jgi:hypothetical protein
MLPSNDAPCIISISTAILRSKVFRFENFWLCSEEFIGIVVDSTSLHSDSAKNITAKFKLLRKRLKDWQASKTGLKEVISN